jgi:molybdenum cofactor guanylyltransferase
MLNGLVLCGGKSTRMGKDKSALIYYDKIQKLHLVELLVPYCDKVYLSQPSESGQESEFPILYDKYTWQSPLNGIITALEFDSTSAWLIVACDMPFLSDDTINELIQYRQKEKYATVFRNPINGFIEPLLGVWEGKITSKILQKIEQKLYSPQLILNGLDCEIIAPSNLDWLINANTVEDYQKYKSLIQSNQDKALK